MNGACILFGILFLIAGIVFAAGKGHIHLAAWKHMPEEEKRKIRIRPLCFNVGTMISLCGILFLVRGLWHSFSGIAFTIAMVLWLIACGLDVWLIGKSPRYRTK